jgi:hypothetical protein
MFKKTSRESCEPARDRGGRGVLLLENALRLGHAPIPSPVGLMKKV